MANVNMALPVPANTVVKLGSVGSGGTIYVQNTGAATAYIAPSSTVSATTGAQLAASGGSFQYTYSPYSTEDVWYVFAASATTVAFVLP